MPPRDLDHLPASLRPALARLRRRLGIALFLEIWPAWAVGSLLLAGTVAVVCRMFMAGAAPLLPWLWLAPIVVAIPVAITCWRRAYRPSELVALADSLSGGQGLLLSLFETDNTDWAQSALAERAATFTLPRFQLRRTMAAVLSAAAFLAVGLLHSAAHRPYRDDRRARRPDRRQSRPRPSSN